jgi:hypothetical protein
VGEQHTSNRPHALVCEQCFRYLGPLELQLGFRLLHLHAVRNAADEESSACPLPDGARPLHNGALKETAGCPASPSGGLQRTALQLLGGQLRMPAVRWEPESSSAATCTGGYIPLHLKQLLAESKGEEGSGIMRRAGIKRKQPLLGRAVLLPDRSDYLFCSHECAGVCSPIASTCDLPVRHYSTGIARACGTAAVCCATAVRLAEWDALQGNAGGQGVPR